jgi:hypothetical protein
MACLLSSVNVISYIYKFSNIKPPMHSWNKPDFMTYYLSCTLRHSRLFSFAYESCHLTFPYHPWVFWYCDLTGLTEQINSISFFPVL